MKTCKGRRSALLVRGLLLCLVVILSICMWRRLFVDSALLQAAMSQYDRPTMAKDTTNMKAALEQGANVNAQSSKGVTSLIYCASYGNVAGVKLLLSYHADVTLKTWGGDTALIAAQRNNAAEIIRLLKAAGAKE